MTDKVEKHISSLEKLTALKDKNKEGSIRWFIKWYEDRYPSRRILYRASGILLLLIALFAAYQLRGVENFTNPAFLAAVTAFVVGLTTFFSWGTAWRGYFIAKVRLEFLMQRWEATLIEARESSDDEKAIELIRSQFRDLLKESGEVIAEETKSFFDSIKFPSVDTKIK